MLATCAYCGASFEASRSTAKYCSEAHRQAAHRAGSELSEQSELARRVVAYDAALAHAAQPGRTETRGSRIPTEEEYVRGEVEATRLAIERGLKDPDTSKLGPDYGARLERAEAYARWRYAGYLAGEIHSL